MTPWNPAATHAVRQMRATLLATIREFFAARGVMEVDTPLLAGSTASDPQIASLTTTLAGPDGSRRMYLQTSPEFAMKRLLAADTGPIYQICKAFRDGEHGKFHNPEFTLLEWYRPGFDHHQLMDEVDEFIATTLALPKTARLTYEMAFECHAKVNPFEVSDLELHAAVIDLGVSETVAKTLERDACLDLLLSQVVQPALTGSTFLYDYPPSQSALARICDAPRRRAERFELYVNGVELANGYHELTDPVELRKRIDHDLTIRHARGLPEVAIDENLLQCMHHGLPGCAGVALGVDRLLMLSSGVDNLAETLTFPVERI